MIRLVVRFALFAALAVAVAWLAERPGRLTIEWLGYRVEDMPVALAIVILLAVFALIWGLVWLAGWLLGRPGALGGFFRRRRRKKGMDALTRGLIAVAAGDGAVAGKQAHTASRALAGQPLAKLLEAQAARLSGDLPRLKILYRQMLEDPQLRIVALRGLYDEARKAGDNDAARAFAERALADDGESGWASQAMLEAHAADEDWPAVEATIERRRKAGLIDRQSANAQRAVALTAQAMAIEDKDPEAAVDLAVNAHRLDPGLIPAAVVAGRLLNAQGALRKSAKVLETTWKLNPHVDIAEVYARARAGDSPLDRLQRIDHLTRLSSGGEEGAVATAEAAIDAHEWARARRALMFVAGERPSARICALMAEVEEGEHGDKGRAREWLARAMRAPRDPVWTADGYVSDRWLPVSPVSGRLGAFEWKVPLAGIAHTGAIEPDDLVAITSGHSGDEIEDIATSDDDATTAVDVSPLEGGDAGSVDGDPLPQVGDVPAADGDADSAPPGKVEPAEPEAAEPPVSEAATQVEPSPQPQANETAAKAGETVAKASKREQAPATKARQPDDPGPEGENVPA